MRGQAAAIVIAWLAVVAPTSGDAQTPAKAAPHATFRLENRLGVETTFDLQDISLEDDELLADALSAYSARLPIRVAENVHISVAAWAIVSVASESGSLAVKTTDGASYKGRGEGTISTSSGDEYSVSSIKTLTAVDITPTWQSYARGSYAKSKEADEQWRVTVTGARGALSYTIHNPRFALQYYSSEGYILGGSNQTASDIDSIGVEVGSDKLKSPVRAFDRIEISSPRKGDYQPRIRLRTPNGTETTGLVAFEVSDSKGPHEADDWMLYGRIDDAGDVTLAISSRSAELAGGKLLLERLADPAPAPPVPSAPAAAPAAPTP